MATNTLLTVEVRREDDVVLARQRARQLAAEFKLDAQDQIRFAAGVTFLPGSTPGMQAAWNCPGTLQVGPVSRK